MKKVPILEEQERQRFKNQREDSEHSSQLLDEPQQLNFVPKMKRKQSMFVTYRGLIQSASLHFSHSLSLLYTTIISQNWNLSNGQKSGISQNASHNGHRLVWNFPFEMTFQTKNPEGWPQIVIILQGKDYFGRSVVKGYGNMHLPVTPGTHMRKIRVFDAIPPSSSASICAFLMGYINEMKQPQKVLSDKDGERQFLQVKSLGEITLKVEVRRYNFDNYNFQ